jgi:hypothetical protein
VEVARFDDIDINITSLTLEIDAARKSMIEIRANYRRSDQRGAVACLDSLRPHAETLKGKLPRNGRHLKVRQAVDEGRTGRSGIERGWGRE